MIASLQRLVVRLGPRRRARLATSWLLLGLTRLMIVALPFSVIRRLLGEHGAGRSLPPTSSVRDRARSRQVAIAIDTASRHTPWQSDCYPQALTARIQLAVARVPHTVSFGLRRSDGGAMLAHAWVSAGDVTVSGGDASDYVEVGSFRWVPRSTDSRIADADVRLLRPDGAERDRSS